MTAPWSATRPIFGKRFRSFAISNLAQAYCEERMMIPRRMNSRPCRKGRTNPTIPRRRKLQPVMRIKIRLLRGFMQTSLCDQCIRMPGATLLARLPAAVNARIRKGAALKGRDTGCVRARLQLCRKVRGTDKARPEGSGRGSIVKCAAAPSSRFCLCVTWTARLEAVPFQSDSSGLTSSRPRRSISGS